MLSNGQSEVFLFSFITGSRIDLSLKKARLLQDNLFLLPPWHFLSGDSSPSKGGKGQLYHSLFKRMLPWKGYSLVKPSSQYFVAVKGRSVL